MSQLPPTLVQLRAALQQLAPDWRDLMPSPDLAPLKPGAVLILIYPVDGIPHLVLTLRPSHLRRHAGQVSLPGGRFESGDGTLLKTALRETEEELGVSPKAIEVWGVLDHAVITVSQYRITPFVGYTPDRPEFQPDANEVAAVLEVPISLLTDESSLREEIWQLGGGPRTVSFYPWGEYKIWGATARVLGQLAQLLDAEARQPAEL